jgi:type III pantothenate kinase
MPMLLAVDIGNTNVVVGLFQGVRLVGKFRMATDAKRTSDEYAFYLKDFLERHALKASDVQAAIVSSVVPELDFPISSMIRSEFGFRPYFVTCDIKLNIRLEYENPAEVGADRIVNAAGAYEKYRCALIVLDFGTATTAEFITADGVYKGGIIMPGFNLMKSSLHVRTSKLPDVQIKRPENVLGKNTIASIQSGLYYLNLGGLDYIIRRIKTDFASDAKVVATGGLANLMADDLKLMDSVEPDLTLQGLCFLHGLNHGS